MSKFEMVKGQKFLGEVSWSTVNGLGQWETKDQERHRAFLIIHQNQENWMDKYIQNMNRQKMPILLTFKYYGKPPKKYSNFGVWGFTPEEAEKDTINALKTHLKSPTVGQIRTIESSGVRYSTEWGLYPKWGYDPKTDKMVIIEKHGPWE
jgi:hypothetical protein